MGGATRDGNKPPLLPLPSLSSPFLILCASQSVCASHHFLSCIASLSFLGHPTSFSTERLTFFSVQDADLKIAAPSIAFLFRASCMDVVSHLLPKGYPRTVPKGYSQYAKYQMLAMTASSAAGVLSTQSLFYAMGIGLGGLPFAAALNWVIKVCYGFRLR